MSQSSSLVLKVVKYWEEFKVDISGVDIGGPDLGLSTFSRVH